MVIMIFVCVVVSSQCLRLCELVNLARDGLEPRRSRRPARRRPTKGTRVTHLPPNGRQLRRPRDLCPRVIDLDGHRRDSLAPDRHARPGHLATRAEPAQAIRRAVSREPPAGYLLAPLAPAAWAAGGGHGGRITELGRLRAHECEGLEARVRGWWAVTREDDRAARRRVEDNVEPTVASDHGPGEAEVAEGHFVAHHRGQATGG